MEEFGLASLGMLASDKVVGAKLILRNGSIERVVHHDEDRVVDGNGWLYGGPRHS